MGEEGGGISAVPSGTGRAGEGRQTRSRAGLLMNLLPQVKKYSFHSVTPAYPIQPRHG